MNGCVWITNRYRASYFPMISEVYMIDLVTTTYNAWGPNYHKVEM